MTAHICTFTRAVRVDIVGSSMPVLICWGCGSESLDGRQPIPRPAVPLAACPCGGRFVPNPRPDRSPRRYCGRDCPAKLADFQRAGQLALARRTT